MHRNFLLGSSAVNAQSPRYTRATSNRGFPMAKKRPGARPTRGRSKTKSAGPNAKKSRPKRDNAGMGNG